MGVARERLASLETLLVRRAAAGDVEARDALAAAHGRLVWSLCIRLGDDPEDAAQASWERVFRGLHRFDPEGPASLSTWIATVTHRVLVDRFRRRKVRGEVLYGSFSDGDGTPSPQEPPDRGPAPDVALDQQRRAARLEAALQRLPTDQRRVVLLHHLHGLSLADIAAQEDVPLGTLKSRLHRARARLAELLTDPLEAR